MKKEPKLPKIPLHFFEHLTITIEEELLDRSIDICTTKNQHAKRLEKGVLDTTCKVTIQNGSTSKGIFLTSISSLLARP